MKAIAEAFQSLEAALEHDQDPAVTAALADALVRASGGLHGMRPTSPADADEFDRRARRLTALAGETAALAAAGRLRGTRQAFEELRTTCVSCHLDFRTRNAERGTYPARDNTLHGRVELLDVDGASRADRSWVLVFLERLDRDVRIEPSDRDLRISQVDRRFQPRVLPVVVGSTVEFPNDDTIFHNVFSLSKVAPFDLGIYEPGETASVPMERTGLVKVYCNIHPEMAASLVVLADPWFALSDSAGRFTIGGMPDGEYRLRAWNDLGAESGRGIVLAGGRVVEVELELRETKRTLQHTNKFGKSYGGDYR